MIDIEVIVGGLISSLLAIGLVEGYLAARRLLCRRALKEVLGLHPGSTLIVAPM